MTLLLAFWLACAPTPAELHDVGPLPAFSLQDQTGSVVTRDTLLGKVWVVDFIFTSCPDVCPVLSARMAEIAGHYAGRDDVRFASFSVDPVTDTPPVLATYAARWSADPARWLFLTGDVDAMKAVVVQGFKMTMEDPGGAEAVLHGSRFVVVDRAGRIQAFPDPAVRGEVEATVDVVLGP